MHFDEEDDFVPALPAAQVPPHVEAALRMRIREAVVTLLEHFAEGER